MTLPFTLNELRAKFEGSMVTGNRVVALIEHTPGKSAWVHIILDPAAPDGIDTRIAPTGRYSEPCDAYVRERLGLPPRLANDNGNPDDDTIDGDSLMAMEFAPVKYIVPGYVVEGLSVLGGKPKVGKSWLALGFAVAVATGELAMAKVPCEQGDVLYLALEDNRRRVKSRINTVRPLSKKRGGLDRLKIRTRASRIDAGLIDEIDEWRSKAANPRLVIIDVFMKVRPVRKAKEDPYAADYAAVIPLQRYASEHRLAIVLVTHTRKMEAEDPLESISGTNGITGAADAVLVLSRNAKGTTLYGRGRDIEEIETAVKLDKGQWTVLGDADEVHRSAERRKIMHALRDATQPLGPREIADVAGVSYGNTRAILHRMASAGEVSKAGRGLYGLCNIVTTMTNNNNVTITGDAAEPRP